MYVCGGGGIRDGAVGGGSGGAVWKSARVACIGGSTAAMVSLRRRPFETGVSTVVA